MREVRAGEDGPGGDGGTLMTRELYSVTCSAPRCRYAVLHVPSEPEARQLARDHAKTGHGVDVHVERRERVVHVPGEARR